MNIFSTKIGNNLFQTYFIECTNSDTRLEFLNYLESVGVEVNGNPNVLNESYESFTIDNARLLNQFHNEKSFNNGKKIFIIEALTINHEAHNALLKMFEEPTADTHFFFLIPRVDILPDTLKSRAHLIYEDRSNLQNDNQDASEFINSNKNKRLEQIANLVAKHKNTETSSPLRDEARELLDGCEFLLHKNFQNLDKNMAWKFNELLKAKKYLSTPGASVKMILEHIALVL